MEVHYPTVDDLVKIIQRKERRAKILKWDLRKAYHEMYMSPGSIHLLGYVVDNLMYFNVTLSMGSRSAANCCQCMTDTVIYIYKRHGYDGLNYLDDLGSTEIDELANEAFECLGNILKDIGIKESESKAQSPSCIATFLGVLYNTIGMTLKITSDKLQELKQILREWMEARSVTLKQLQQLLGKLNFVCGTVRAGRVFVSRIINMIKVFPVKGRRRVSGEFRKDIRWWYKYINIFDGVSMMPESGWSPPRLAILSR